MKKAKTILFIGNNYCSTIEDLRSTFESNNKSNYIGKEGKPLRKELLAYFKDGLLSKWLEEHGYNEKASQLPMWEKSSEISNNELFKVIYKIIFEKDCMGNLDSEFSLQAELLRCEVDDIPVKLINNTLVLTHKAKEIKFVFRALEEIDSGMSFKLSKIGSKRKPLLKKTDLEWYANGSEFSISFGPNSLGHNCDGNYELQFDSNENDVVCRMEIFPKHQRVINCQDGIQLTLYRVNDFWITNPYYYDGTGYCVEEAARMLKRLNTRSKPYLFRLANKNEIKSLVGNLPNEVAKVFPSGKGISFYPIDDGKFIWFWDGWSNIIEKPKNFYFVAVLNE